MLSGILPGPPSFHKGYRVWTAACCTLSHLGSARLAAELYEALKVKEAGGHWGVEAFTAEVMLVDSGAVVQRQRLLRITCGRLGPQHCMITFCASRASVAEQVQMSFSLARRRGGQNTSGQAGPLCGGW
jgi:hypothetical protein